MIKNIPSQNLVNSSFAIIEIKKCFLFQLRDNKDHIWYPSMYGLFGGKIEDNENEREAIKREIYEETNLNLTNFKLINSISIYKESKSFTRYVFSTKINCIPDNFCINEGQGYKLFSISDIDKIKDLIVPNDFISISNYLRLNYGTYLC